VAATPSGHPCSPRTFAPFNRCERKSQIPTTLVPFFWGRFQQKFPLMPNVSGKQGLRQRLCRDGCGRPALRPARALTWVRSRCDLSRILLHGSGGLDIVRLDYRCAGACLRRPASGSAWVTRSRLGVAFQHVVGGFRAFRVGGSNSGLCARGTGTCPMRRICLDRAARQDGGEQSQLCCQFTRRNTRTGR
jgi:hypothetical protein